MITFLSDRINKFCYIFFLNISGLVIDPKNNFSIIIPTRFHRPQSSIRWWTWITKKQKVCIHRLSSVKNMFSNKIGQSKPHIFTANRDGRASCIMLLLLKSTRLYRLKIIKNFLELNRRRLCIAFEYIIIVHIAVISRPLSNTNFIWYVVNPIKLTRVLCRTRFLCVHHT